jgi:DNA polymerase III alpha subunit
VQILAERGHSLGNGSCWQRPSNQSVRIAGCVIARQRPGTAKGFVFLSLEDETGIANIILTPDLFERERLTVTCHRFLHIHGLLQNNDGVVHVKAKTLAPFQMPEVAISPMTFTRLNTGAFFSIELFPSGDDPPRIQNFGPIAGMLSQKR